MIVVSISEAKNRLSAFIDKVKRGDTVVITDRGRPVAQLESVARDQPVDEEGRLARLERNGLIKRGKQTPPTQMMRDPPPSLRDGVDILQVLLDERAEDR